MGKNAGATVLATAGSEEKCATALELGSDPCRYEEFGAAWKQYCASDFQAVVDSVYPLAEGAKAQEQVLSGDFFGKIILAP